MKKERPLFRKTSVLFFLILAFGLLFGGAINWVHSSKIPWVGDWENYVETKAKEAGIKIIYLRRAHEIFEENRLLFIDARSAEKFQEKHIKRAVSLPFDDFENRPNLLGQILEIKDPVVIYCQNRSCDDGLLLAQELREMGKTNLLYYVDGFELWEAEGCSIDSEISE